MRKFLAILIAKLAMISTRLLKRGGGTAIPGFVAQLIDRNILSKLVKNLKHGSIIITGTNGKTTTSKMLYDILTSSGLEVIANQSGSNLSQGLVTALIARSNITGSRTRGDVAIFEIDEATMPLAISSIKPKLVGVTNIFRDQLDRYGEVDKTAMLIGNSLKNLDTDAYLMLNADDPLVASLSSYNTNAFFYGIEDSEMKTESKIGIDSKDCVKCGRELDFEYRYFGHLGKYKCKHCGLERPKPDNSVFKIDLSPETTSITLHTSAKQNLDIVLNIPGLYNVYNALLAASLASMLGTNGEHIKKGLEDFASAFGRMEKIQVKDKNLMLLLIKNPIGLTESLRSFTGSGSGKNNFLFCLNDNFADGTDISWIWDGEVEQIKDKATSIICSGIRAEELALRFKYANVDPKIISLEKDLKKALDIGLSNIAPGQTLYVLPTYTAMMGIRNILAKGGYVKDFWRPPGM